MKKTLNKRLNRYEITKPKKRHAYIKDYSGMQYANDAEYDGYIKCKLVHRDGLSVVFPDQVFVELGGELRWIQPFFFGPNQIGFLDDENICRVPIDISCGVKIWCEFKTSDQLNSLKDGSIFYRCKIKAPKYLYPFTTGRARLVENQPQIELFHHTGAEAALNISQSKEFWATAWNIQGTKKLENIAYLYLTVLPKIHCNDDLFEIAMSSNGILPLRLDQNLGNKPDLELEVYRDSSQSRTKTISSWVKCTDLTPQPVYNHRHGDVYYEVVCQFIHRIGVERNTTVKIDGKTLNPNAPKMFDYCVIGDASRLSGLQAPLDEECPEHIFKIERFAAGEEILGFWEANQNTDLFTNKDIELVEVAND